MENGPFLVQRVADRVCGTRDYKLQTRERCIGLEVHPPNVFYPLKSKEWWMIFSGNHTTYMLNQFKDSVGIHTWNTHRKRRNIRNDKNSAYSVLGRMHCPKVTELWGQDF